MKIKNIYNPTKWLQKEKREKNNIWFQNKIYKATIMKNDKKKYFSLELSTIWLIIKRVFTSAIYLGILIIISIIIDKIFIVFGWKQFLLEYIKYDKETFISFLISCISIAGFLIALFYANLSGIFTSRYAFLSSRISKELLNEYTNKKYVKSIQNYIIIVLFVLLLNIIGFTTDIILATIILFLTMRIIVIFIELSKRIFTYSDTIIIGHNTMEKIISIFDKIIVGSYKYDNISFQNYHYNQANENIKSLDDLSHSLIKDNDFEGLNTLLRININLISIYSKLKNKIPYNSLWFPNIGKGKSWFTESDAEILIAVNTGTSLSPNVIRDKYFLENRLFEINERIINFFIKNQKYENMYMYFNLYHECFYAFSQDGDIEYWYKTNKKNIDFIVNNIDFKQIENNEYGIALLDLFSLFYIDISLSFTKYIKNVVNQIDNVNWNMFDYSVALKSNLLIFNNEQFTNFVKKIENEKYIERTLVTPKSYIMEFINMKICEYLECLINNHYSSIKDLDEISKSILKAKSLKGSATVNSRIVELYNKTLHQMNEIEQLYDKIKLSDKGNYKYKIIDFAEKRKEIKNIYISSIEQYTKIVVGLYFEKYKIEEMQLDFIGEVYYHLTFLMLDLIYDNDYVSFEKLYSNFACICSISHSYIRDIVSPDNNPPYVLNKYTMTTINFMNISGFAIYYSHLIEDDRWENLILEYAEKFIGNETGENKGNLVTTCKSCAEAVSNSISGITILSTSIKSSIENFVRNKNIIKYKNVGHFGQTTIDNKDKLIRNFALEDDFGFMGEFYEVYMQYCINKYLDDNKYVSKNGWEEDD